MTPDEVVQQIVAALERAGCQLVRRSDRLGVFPGRRLLAPLSEFLSPWRRELMGVTPETAGEIPLDGPDCVRWIGPPRHMTSSAQLRDTNSIEFAVVAAVAFAGGA